MRTPANGAGVSYVVPYVGTWIEICIGLSVPVHDVVVPYVGTWIEIFFAIYHSPALQVVPYVGTWIEMTCRWWITLRQAVVPYVGTWIEIKFVLSFTIVPFSRSLRGNVDRNGWAIAEITDLIRRSLRGNVDRNYSKSDMIFSPSCVVPYVGTWIEILSRSKKRSIIKVVPYVGTWIEISLRLQ